MDVALSMVKGFSAWFHLKLLKLSGSCSECDD
uniref:Uncharacterized protein n=1 Tax=Setaria italica TaxID=4555 RepID=K4ANZ0_SETIT